MLSGERINEARRMKSVRVQSAEEWLRLRSLAEAVFDFDARFPLAVSSLPIPESPFFDGEIIFGQSGWDLVSSLAIVHGDSDVNVLVVDPDADAFIDATGEYGAFSCQSDGADDCYLAGLFDESSRGVAGQIGCAAETVAVFGSAGRWGIWVERNIAGLVASADRSELGVWELENGPFLTADDALDGFLGVNLGNVGPDSEFATALRRNYGVFPED